MRGRVVALGVGFQEGRGEPWRDCKAWVSAVGRSVPCVASWVVACRFVVYVCGRRAVWSYGMCGYNGMCRLAHVQVCDVVRERLCCCVWFCEQVAVVWWA